MTQEEPNHENQKPTVPQPNPELEQINPKPKPREIEAKTIMCNSEASQPTSAPLETPTEDPKVTLAIKQFEEIKETLIGPEPIQPNDPKEGEKKAKTWILLRQDPKTDSSKP